MRSGDRPRVDLFVWLLALERLFDLGPVVRILTFAARDPACAHATILDQDQCVLGAAAEVRRVDPQKSRQRGAGGEHGAAGGLTCQAMQAREDSAAVEDTADEVGRATTDHDDRYAEPLAVAKYLSDCAVISEIFHTHEKVGAVAGKEFAHMERSAVDWGHTTHGLSMDLEGGVFWPLDEAGAVALGRAGGSKGGRRKSGRERHGCVQLRGMVDVHPQTGVFRKHERDSTLAL